MKVHEFFEMMERANEFKALVGEAIKTKVSIVCNDNVVGAAYTFEQFVKVLDDEFNPFAKDGILNAEVRKTSCNREFKIVYDFFGVKKNIKLFVE